MVQDLHGTRQNHTLVVNHVYSREEVMGSNPTTPKFYQMFSLKFGNI